MATFLCVVVFGAGLYIGASKLIGMYYAAELAALDLDGDGGFSERELTPAAEVAMRRYTSDTGRVFAHLVAGPAMLLWVSLNYVVLFVGAKLWRIVRVSRRL